ncbi:CxxH/CxxC protein [Paenibacillus sp. y28]|uniref:CxxH/CxxC protein n=1 Tax=Paenibacillus sp. y28 TaxID=3129110 RepID=UPI0030187478
MSSTIAVCRAHLELAIDWFLDETLEAPDVLTLQEAAERNQKPDGEMVCKECGQPAEVIVCPCEKEPEPV